MQSFENNKPASANKRIGLSLNVDTDYKGKGKEMTVPLTQSSRVSKGNVVTANRALRERPSATETFLDDSTPVDISLNKGNETERGLPNRDSHDLSMSPQNVTRNSLVDHMLLSFDQFSYAPEDEGFSTRYAAADEQRLYSSFGDEEPYPSSQPFSSFKNTRAAGHNYSYSSDYENGDDSSRYSDKLSRGRRSNSSSNFQSGLGRINSVRNDNNSTFSRVPPQTIPPRGVHSRSGKGSKASSSNSIDLGYAQNTGPQRWGHGLAGRSSSFDYGSVQSRQPVAMEQLVNNGVAAFDPYDYDAAPTPTIAGGPRRFRPPSPVLTPKQDPIREPALPKLERKRSTRSSKSAYRAKTSSGVPGGRVDYGLNDRAHELPPLPAFLKEVAAPAPLVGYGKTKDTPPGTAPKERHGFFRRVFGSRNSTPTSAEAPQSHGLGTSVDKTDRPSSKPHIANQMKHYAPAPPREPPPPPKEQPHVVTKKPSSFFRRRKKSVSESEPHVPVPIVPPAFRGEDASGPSPVSSLRKVMNPYLKSPAKSPLDPKHPQHYIDAQLGDDFQDERHQRGFSPDYEPDQSATIRAVKPDSRGTTEIPVPSYVPLHYVPTQKLLSADLNPSQDISSDSHSKEERDATFLQDSSDIDPDSHSTHSSSVPAPKDTVETTWLNGVHTPSSPAVARDMALVAEYERHYSKRSPTSAKSERARASPALESPRSKMSSPARDEQYSSYTPSKSQTEERKDSHTWIEPSSEEEDQSAMKLILPSKTSRSRRNSGSTGTEYKSASSLPIVQIEGEDEEEVANRKLKDASEFGKSPDVVPRNDTIPNEADRQRAKEIYDGNEDFILKGKAAAWIGEEGPLRLRTLVAYMELYDFANLNILAALRIICGRLMLKAESQQVDRILDAFAKRWCECNPNHGFKATDVVHTICYSILLLNTDLHLADIEQKMTRSQFIKNTMPTIKKSIAESAPDAFEQSRPTVLPGKSSAFAPETVKSPVENSLKIERSSIEAERPSWRTSFKPPARVDSDSFGGNAPTPLDYDTPIDDCGPLVKAPFHGTLRTWEVQVEIVLKDFYSSIRNERLPLFGAAPAERLQTQQSTNSLAVIANGVLRRTPSVLSKSPSESMVYRGRTAETMRAGNGKFINKNRSRPRLYPTSGHGSSRTSLDDQASMWSPSVSSSTWSKYSLGKTQTSMSVDSFGSAWPQGDYQQSIGFANALSQAIIREETIGSSGSVGSDEFRVAPLLEDESLELAGAPWAKEGIVKHKHHLEALDKKAKDRNWNEVFAVVEKGYMSLFSFSSKSMRNKSKFKPSGSVVGGGNWQENAENLGSFLLRQTIASSLPSPGYSKARPHVWALSLPTGAVHLFQVGTPDIVKEFVSTANYWSARLSNHPLVGGISNIEYGWSDAIVNNALVAAIHESTTSRPSTSGARPSMHSSLRSSLDQGYNGTHTRARLPGDKVTISDWTPPTQSMRASNLMETDQLNTLQTYVDGIEEEFQKHNQLRSPMLLAFTPRHMNGQKAMANWEKKSSYLLREVVKFRTYIDSLQAAESGKRRIYKEREERKRELEEAIAVSRNQDAEAGNITLRPE